VLKHTLPLICLLALATLANIAPGRWVEESSTTERGEHPQITMADEEVTVFFWQDCVLVEAWYDMHNSGEVTRNAMMLPMYFEYPDEVSDFEPSVTVSINGELLDSYIVRRKQYDEAGNHSATLVSALFRGGQLAAETTTRFTVSYLAPYTAEGCFEYPLGTGGGWRNPIGHGVLWLRPGPGADWSIVEEYGDIALPEPSFDGEAARWEFTELEPPTDTCYWLRVK